MSVVGTRPNFMKIAPIAASSRAAADAFEHVLVHTGQHYDDAMSRGLLRASSASASRTSSSTSAPGTHAEQTARVMERLEPVLASSASPTSCSSPATSTRRSPPRSSRRSSGSASATSRPGCARFDRTMPEEINRHRHRRDLATCCSSTRPRRASNLLREGAPASAIHAVGNTMIDTLVAMRPRIDAAGAPAAHGLTRGGYLVVTLHRPGARRRPAARRRRSRALERGRARAAGRLPRAPAHARRAWRGAGIAAPRRASALVEPLGYLEFLALLAEARRAC